MPGPATKVGHEMETSKMELMLLKVDGLKYGQWVHINEVREQLKFLKV